MILCIGEILADLIGTERNGIVAYERHAGGAPFNVACDIKALGGKCGFFGRVGKDAVGGFLRDFARAQKFEFLDIAEDEARNTTLAFVDVDREGERRFSFYRRNTADYALEFGERLVGAVQNAHIVHIGSLMLSERRGRAFAQRAMDEARKSGALVSFDVNLRKDIFPSDDAAKRAYRAAVRSADIVKMSADELEFFTGTDDIQKGASRAVPDGRLLFVTYGGRGSAASYRGAFFSAPAMRVDAVDATGAGDAFFAGALFLLDSVLRAGRSTVSEEEMRRILTFANACGGLAAAKRGAIGCLPSYEAVNAFVEKGGKR